MIFERSEGIKKYKRKCSNEPDPSRVSVGNEETWSIWTGGWLCGVPIYRLTALVLIFGAAAVLFRT